MIFYNFSVHKSGRNCKTYASLKSDLAAKVLLPASSVCADQALTVVAMYGITIWTDSYLYATKPCCKYFCVKTNRNRAPCRNFIEVSKLSTLYVCICGQIYVAGQQFQLQPDGVGVVAGISIIPLSE